MNSSLATEIKSKAIARNLTPSAARLLIVLLSMVPSGGLNFEKSLEESGIRTLETYRNAKAELIEFGFLKEDQNGTWHVSASTMLFEPHYV